MKLIVGLGNPGPDYAGTRHNAGFEVIDLLAKRHNIAVSRRDHQAVFGEGLFNSRERVMLVRPMTFMNLSGDAVASIVRYYRIEISDIIVIVDDIALPVGKIRLRLKGSSGGQNGLDSIIKRLATQDVSRVRVGVGSPVQGSAGLVSHVLSRFKKEEIPVMAEAYERAADAIEYAIADTFENAMNRYNV